MCCEKQHIHFCYEKLWKKQRDFSDTFLQTNPKPVKFFINISFTSDFIVYVFFFSSISSSARHSVEQLRKGGGGTPTNCCLFFFTIFYIWKTQFFSFLLFSLYMFALQILLNLLICFPFFFCCNCNNIICCLMCCCFLKYIFLFCCIVLQKVSKSCFFSSSRNGFVFL